MGGIIVTKGGGACGDVGGREALVAVLWPMPVPRYHPTFAPPEVVAGLTLLLIHAAYQQKEVPNKVQGDGLHKDAGSFF